MAHDKQYAVRTPTVPSGRRAQSAGDTGPARLVCLGAAERADDLLPSLREHFAGEPRVAVQVERRGSNPAGCPADPERHIHRAPVAERDPVRALPPELRHEALYLRLGQPMEPLRRTHEDTDTADLVGMSIAMHPEAASELWWRISARAGPICAAPRARRRRGRRSRPAGPDPR